jgi:transcriptional regulator with XRE-family HTH domain
MEWNQRLSNFISTNYENQKKFAERTGINYTYVSQLVKGLKNPGSDMLNLIYDSGCSIDWLLYGEGDMYAGNDAGMYLAEQHGYNKQKDKTEEMYDMMKDLSSFIKEGMIRDFGKKAAANSKYGDKDYNDEDE